MSGICFIGGRQSDAAVTAERFGGKAANLARLDALGLRVPAAIGLDTELCRDYVAHGMVPAGFTAHLSSAIRGIEDATGLTLGGRQPLILSVRSSPVVSMPGMLETITNIGLTEQAVHGIVRRTGNPRLAWDNYRRVIRSFGTVVLGVSPGVFDAIEQQQLDAAGATGLDEADPLTLREIAREQASVLAGRGGPGLPADPIAQLEMAIQAVWRSWCAPKASTYRRLNAIDDAMGTGVIVQAMVFGNAGPRSGSGVGFTRNPSTGADELYVDFSFTAQGDDIVSGRHVVTDSSLLPRLLPGPYAELTAARTALERALRDMQDFEFTIEEGQLYFLQTRDAKRTPWAALQIAVDLANAGIIERDTAIARLAPYELGSIRRSVARPGPDNTCLATGVAASPGAATGAIAFSAARAANHRAPGEPILVRHDLTTDDVAGLSAAAGMLTAVGGRTSHAAVVARQLDRPCVAACRDLLIDEDEHGCVIGGRRFEEGDVITIDGDTGRVYAGTVPVVSERPDALIETVDGWREVMAG